MPARLINIKYITIRAEKVASPVTALQPPSYWVQVFLHLLFYLQIIILNISTVLSPCKTTRRVELFVEMWNSFIASTTELDKLFQLLDVNNVCKEKNAYANHNEKNENAVYNYRLWY